MGVQVEGRCRGEGGAAIIEAAIATPVVFVLLFTIFDFGFMMYTREALNNASTVLARQASVQGNEAEADYRIIQSAKNAFETLDQERITMIVIFRATGPNSS